MDIWKEVGLTTVVVIVRYLTVFIVAITVRMSPVAATKARVASDAAAAMERATPNTRCMPRSLARCRLLPIHASWLGRSACTWPPGAAAVASVRAAAAARAIR